MKISKRKLEELVDASIDVPMGQVMWAVQENYCRQLTALGMCTENCRNCQFYLENIFSRYRDADRPAKPVGLLTYLARDEREAYRESFRGRKTRAADERPLEQTLLEEA